MSPARSARVSTITRTDPIWAVVQILQHSSLTTLGATPPALSGHNN